MKPPYTTITIICATFGAQLIELHRPLFNALALYMPGCAQWQWWQPFTYQFVHASLLGPGALHLVANMLVLLFMGPRVEAKTGSMRFALFYLLCGATAGLIGAVCRPLPCNALVGASGAVYAVLTLYVMLYPQKRLKFLFIPYTFSGIEMLVMLLAIEVAAFVWLDNTSISHVTHITGIAIGYLVGLIFFFKNTNHKN
jgi:membrane associated rhomboid family serine protease